MYKRFPVMFLLLLVGALQSNGQEGLPKLASGKLERIDSFQSKYVSTRKVDVWLPEGFSDTIKYAVLYMHDGQMLYDPEQTWNRQAWNVDDVAGSLLAANKVQPFIVVGIWNGGATRHTDYFPQKPFETLSAAEKDTVNAQLQRAGRSGNNFEPRSDAYLKFIVKELKPYIDRRYPVYRDREHTFIMGSSMGGLISLYALCEFPKVFGGAACLSTHWVGTFTDRNNPIPGAFISYLRKKLPPPRKHKIYFDCGDQALDALYPAIQKKADTVMKAKGYAGTHWITQYFPGEDHSEQAWNKRLHMPLQFLLRQE